VIGDAARDAATARRARHARIATALIFAAIVANLVLQLVAGRI
jgi:hypothetical protein